MTIHPMKPKTAFEPRIRPLKTYNDSLVEIFINVFIFSSKILF